MNEMSFEAALAELETIVKRLECGVGTLDEALKDYETAISLVRECAARLESAEQRLTILNKEETEE